MTDAEKLELARLMQDKAFVSFLYRNVFIKGGLFSASTTGTDGRDLSHAEGRRGLALDILAEIEACQATKSPDGQPVFGSIQILVGFAQSMTKEKALGRRRDPYGDLNSDGDGAE